MGAEDEPGGDDVAIEPSNVCVCFRVPLNKIVKHYRLTKPAVASQLSGCYGAGTGCGWCIPFLEKIYEQLERDPDREPTIGLSEAEYLERRRGYHKKINAAKMKDERG